MPDVLIEVASKTDDWRTVKAEIDKYVAGGAGYALAVDPRTRETYELGRPPADLEIDIDAIIDA